MNVYLDKNTKIKSVVVWKLNKDWMYMCYISRISYSKKIELSKQMKKAINLKLWSKNEILIVLESIQNRIKKIETEDTITKRKDPVFYNNSNFSII